MGYARSWCDAMTEDNLVEAGYDAVHAAMPNSPTLLRIWREHAMGEDFPEEFWHISFLTIAEAERIARELSLGPDSSLVDLGCGAGGPALYFARTTGARVTGVDLSGAAVKIAGGRAEALGLSGVARFQKGSFTETGLATASADTAVSFDALQYAPDKAAAFAEAARILRPGGRIAFTAFELEPGRVANLPVIGTDPVADYRPALDEASFDVLAYEETPGWEARLTNAYSAIVEAKDVLMHEMGQLAVAALLSEIILTLEQRPYRRRVFCLAQRR
jgi:ubiquinone/menaquinone biosynthesis C-methylase UbiE